MVDVVPVEHPGLGNSSYLLDLGDGRAAVVDPQRDIRPYLTAALHRGLSIGYAVETHVHADFVTGSRELAGAGRADRGCGRRGRGIRPPGAGRRSAAGRGRVDAGDGGHSRSHATSRVLVAARRRRPRGGVHRWGLDRGRGGSHGSGQSGPHRGAGPGRLPIGPPASVHVGRRPAGVADARARIVLLRRRRPSGNNGTESHIAGECPSSSCRQASSSAASGSRSMRSPWRVGATNE